MKTLDHFRGPRISVDKDRCELFGTCMWEAPRLFVLEKDGRLRHRRHLTGQDDYAQATAAARSCPMQAIALRGMTDE